MKYCVLILDGMADYAVDALNGATPMEVADKPTIDMLAKKSLCGTSSNTPAGMVPESDTANLAILSYDPKVYSKGRSPLEAMSMGLTMDPDTTAFRCNVVTMSDDGGAYEKQTMIDHSSDEITTAEADELIKALNAEFADNDIHFYTGVSYRHCLLWRNAPAFTEFMRPHDILTQCVENYLPCEPFRSMQIRSMEILRNHPVNLARKAKGLRPANSMWLWSPGKKPALPSFSEKWGIKGSVISAVDLIKGIGICAGMEVVNVEGATGNINTNYEGKAQAAINCFKKGSDLVYIHVEAPDECGHRGEAENKVKSISYIDKRILATVYDYLTKCGDDFKILVLPDHPTPICKRTHTIDPVPFMIYDSRKAADGVEKFTEKSCADKNYYLEHGYNLFDLLIEK